MSLATFLGFNPTPLPPSQTFDAISYERLKIAVAATYFSAGVSPTSAWRAADEFMLSIPDELKRAVVYP